MINVKYFVLFKQTLNVIMNVAINKFSTGKKWLGELLRWANGYSLGNAVLDHHLPYNLARTRFTLNTSEKN